MQWLSKIIAMPYVEGCQGQLVKWGLLWQLSESGSVQQLGLHDALCPWAGCISRDVTQVSLSLVNQAGMSDCHH